MARRIAIRVTVIVAVLLIFFAAGFGLRGARDQLAADRTTVGSPQTAPSGDEAKYHELAERLLNFGYFPAGPTSVTLLPGTLPADPAITLPNVTGARLIGTAVRTRGSDRSADIVLDAPGDPEQVAAAYEQGFKDQGWTAPTGAFAGGPGGGFQAATPPVSKLVCKGENALISISVAARPGAPNDVRLNVQPNLSSLGGGSACSAKSRSQPGGSNHLPAIRPPDGVRLDGGGGGSSSSISGSIGGGSGNVSRQSSDATATGSLSAGELEAAFAKQLVAAGWTRLAGRDDGALAWSTWTSNESGWSGTLIVADTATKDRRSLLLRAEGPSN